MTRRHALLVAALVAAPPSAAHSADLAYIAVELPGLPGGWITRPFAINASGVVVGEANTDALGDFYPLAVAWSPEGEPTVITGFGQSVSRANAVNDAGAVVGITDELAHAFLWEGRGIVDLGPAPFITSNALDVNDDGLIVGLTTGASGGLDAARWVGGVLAPLPTLFGCCSAAHAVNGTGVVVGESTNAENRIVAVRWIGDAAPEVVADLGGLYATAYDLNAAGTIVGTAVLPSEIGQPILSKAFMHANGTTTILPDLGGWGHEARAVNDAGTIVGSSNLPLTQPRAVVWHDGAVHDLNDLVIGGATDLVLVRATAINAAGQIVGSTDDERAFRLDPVVIVPADLDGDGTVDFADLVVLLGAWGPCAPAAPCPADLDASGDVGLADLLILLAAWS